MVAQTQEQDTDASDVEARTTIHVSRRDGRRNGEAHFRSIRISTMVDVAEYEVDSSNGMLS